MKTKLLITALTLTIILTACTREPPRIMLVVLHNADHSTCNILGGNILINNEEVVRVDGIQPDRTREHIELLAPHMPVAPVTINAWCDDTTESLHGALAPRPPGRLPQYAVISLPYSPNNCEPTPAGPSICIGAESLLQLP